MLTPGPTNTLLAIAGGARGFKASSPLIAAEIGGYLMTITPVALFAATLLSDQPLVGSALKLGSAAWVLFLAVQLWGLPADGLLAQGSAGFVTFRRVFVTTVLNPKALIIGLVFMPHGAPQIVLPYLALFSAIVVLVASFWLTAGATLLRAARHSHPTLVYRCAATILLGFSTMLAGSSLGLI
nr:hypothetical protein [Rhizobium sp. CG5]